MSDQPTATAKLEAQIVQQCANYGGVAPRCLFTERNWAPAYSPKRCQLCPHAVKGVRLQSEAERAAHTEAALVAALAREARLREALEPFAAFVANTDPVWDDRRRIATLNYDFDKLTVGIFREACAALATREPQVKS